jgi:hypothetical protein
MIMDGKLIKDVPMMYLGKDEDNWTLFFLDQFETVYQMFSRVNDKWSVYYLKEYPKDFKKSDNVRISKKFVTWVLEKDTPYRFSGGFDIQAIRIQGETVRNSVTDDDETDEEDIDVVSPVSPPGSAGVVGWDEVIPTIIRQNRNRHRQDIVSLSPVKIAVLPTHPSLMYPNVSLTDAYFWRINKTGAGLSTRYNIVKRGKKVRIHDSLIASFNAYKARIPSIVDFLVESNAISVDPSSCRPVKNRFEIMDFS